MHAGRRQGGSDKTSMQVSVTVTQSRRQAAAYLNNASLDSSPVVWGTKLSGYHHVAAVVQAPSAQAGQASYLGTVIGSKTQLITAVVGASSRATLSDAAPAWVACAAAHALRHPVPRAPGRCGC